MKKIIILLMVLLFSSCAGFQECRILKQFYYVDPECPSGYEELAITGHASSCAEQNVINEIKKYCGIYF